MELEPTAPGSSRHDGAPAHNGVDGASHAGQACELGICLFLHGRVQHADGVQGASVVQALAPGLEVALYVYTGRLEREVERRCLGCEGPRAPEQHVVPAASQGEREREHRLEVSARTTSDHE